MSPRLRWSSLAALLAGGFLFTINGAAGGQEPTPASAKKTAVPAPTTPHWGYGAEHGPGEWGELCPEFSPCGNGRSQSPIDISGASSAKLPAIETSYQPAQLRVVHHEHLADVINNGHTVQVNYAGGSTLTMDGQTFELLQYHFHSPSEHTLEVTSGQDCVDDCCSASAGHRSDLGDTAEPKGPQVPRT